jgi:hypothetical protein
VVGGIEDERLPGRKVSSITREWTGAGVSDQQPVGDDEVLGLISPAGGKATSEGASGVGPVATSIQAITFGKELAQLGVEAVAPCLQALT